MEVTIKGSGDIDMKDPRTRVLAIEAATRSICEHAGTDPADAVMMLLTAAVHISRQMQKPGSNIEVTVAHALGAAIVAADDFFTLKPHVA